MKTKRLISLSLFVLVLSGGSFIRCSDKCQVKKSYIVYKPIYKTSDELKAMTGLTSPTPIRQLGKIYWKDDNLYINETGKGIHLINNTSPSSPINEAFLAIPGNNDLVIQNNILIADSYADLVMFDISDWKAIKEVNRIPFYFTNYSSYGYRIDAEKGVVTAWEKTETITVEENDCAPSNLITSWGGYYYNDGIALPTSSSPVIYTGAASAKTNTSSAGKSGSLARFVLANQYLYTLDNYSLITANVANPIQPVKTSTVAVNWNSETLFPYKNNLFIGTRTGMLIYDLTSPETPAYVSSISHFYSCDPVVVEGNKAYVTLRDGNTCRAQNINELQVIDISTITSPVLLKTYPMKNPYGLGIDNTMLFVCDGTGGLKIYDASDSYQIDSNLVATYTDLTPIDVIPHNKVAMVIAADGLYQYDYTNPKKINLLSKLTIE